MLESGVYIIRNCVNGKFYIGSALDVQYRWRKHQEKLNKGNHHNKHIQRAWNKYGYDKFLFEVIHYCEPNLLLKLEQFLLDLYFGTSQCYNCSNSSKSPRGFKHSDEAKRKISIAGTGRFHTEESKNKISSARMGMKFSRKHRENISKARTGISINAGENNPMFGKRLSEEHRIKIGLKVQGEKHPNVKLTTEYVRWIRDHYGRGYSLQTLADKFKVSKKLILQIVKRRAWKHI